MRIVIAGGHGQIAMRLERQLAAAGHEAVGLIRNAGQADDLRAAGAEPVVLDLESASVEDVAGALRGADAVVFAAGAGPGSTSERKETVDRAAAVLLADAAERAGIRRYVIISSTGADAERQGDDIFDAYLRAKGAADDAIRSRDALDWTVLRPGPLTNDAGTGRVLLRTEASRVAVAREDVASVIVALLGEPRTIGLTLELMGGSDAVEDAVRAAAEGR